MKGLSFLALIVLIALVIIMSEFLYLQFGIHQSEILVRNVRETAIIEHINDLEFIKRVQGQALEYSFYQSYNFTGTRGGYLDLSSVKSLDCIPYWKIYDTETSPDIIANLESASLFYFNAYMDKFKTDEMSIPNYYEIEIKNPTYSEISVDANSQENLMFETEKLEITDESNFAQQIPSGLIQEVDVGKEYFIETDNIKNAVESGISKMNFVTNGLKTSCNNNCPTEEDIFKEINGIGIEEAESEIKGKVIEKIAELRDTINRNLVQSKIEVSIESVTVDARIDKSCSDESSGDCCTKTCDFSFYATANVLLNVKNTKSIYPIGNGFKQIILKFRIVSGNDPSYSQPNTNDCAVVISIPPTTSTSSSTTSSMPTTLFDYEITLNPDSDDTVSGKTTSSIITASTIPPLDSPFSIQLQISKITTASGETDANNFGISVSFSPMSLVVTDGKHWYPNRQEYWNTTMEISTQSTTPANTYYLTIKQKGNSSPSQEKTKIFTLNVASP